MGRNATGDGQFPCAGGLMAREVGVGSGLPQVAVYGQTRADTHRRLERDERREIDRGAWALMSSDAQAGRRRRSRGASLRQQR